MKHKHTTIYVLHVAHEYHVQDYEWADYDEEEASYNKNEHPNWPHNRTKYREALYIAQGHHALVQQHAYFIKFATHVQLDYIVLRRFHNFNPKSIYVFALNYGKLHNINVVSNHSYTQNKLVNAPLHYFHKAPGRL